MKRVWLVIGLGIGFVLGSRAGRQTYETLEAKVRDIAQRPEVKRVADPAKEQEEGVVVASEHGVTAASSIADVESASTKASSLSSSPTSS